MEIGDTSYVIERCLPNDIRWYHWDSCDETTLDEVKEHLKRDILKYPDFMGQKYIWRIVRMSTDYFYQED